MRVVNAVLTQLDQLKSYPNVLVIATSNVTGRIDLAFVDRADMKVHIGKGFLIIGSKRTWAGLITIFLLRSNSFSKRNKGRAGDSCSFL